MMLLKGWFNSHYPRYRVCLHPWCFLVESHDGRCYLHQHD